MSNSKQPENSIVPLRERLERLHLVKLSQFDRQIAVEAEEIAVDDPELVAWALAVLLHWQE